MGGKAVHNISDSRCFSVDAFKVAILQCLGVVSEKLDEGTCSSSELKATGSDEASSSTTASTTTADPPPADPPTSATVDPPAAGLVVRSVPPRPPVSVGSGPKIN